MTISMLCLYPINKTHHHSFTSPSLSLTLLFSSHSSSFTHNELTVEQTKVWYLPPAAVNSKLKSNNLTFCKSTHKTLTSFGPPFLSPLLSFLPLFPFSHKHKTILSYPALAWENRKKHDKRPRKEPEKWCESESRAEVVKGESGQEGRRVRAREWETESTRKGKEKKGGSRCFWINKTCEQSQV